MSDFERFGYNTDQGCDICNEKPAKIEPRFGYKVCVNHFHLSPVEVSDFKHKNNNESIYKKMP